MPRKNKVEHVVLKTTSKLSHNKVGYNPQQFEHYQKAFFRNNRGIVANFLEDSDCMEKIFPNYKKATARQQKTCRTMLTMTLINSLAKMIVDDMKL